MASMSKIQIIGNVGRDPELRMTPDGKAVCEFSVAVNRVSNRGGERKEETDWYRISCWGRQAETAQQVVQKGQQIFVDGRFTPRTYTAKDGQERTSLDISCNDFQLLGSRRDREAAGQAPTAQQGESGRFDPDKVDPDKVDPDEIPF